MPFGDVLAARLVAKAEAALAQLASKVGAVAKTSRLLETHMEVWSVVLGICVGAAFAYSLSRLRL